MYIYIFEETPFWFLIKYKYLHELGNSTRQVCPLWGLFFLNFLPFELLCSSPKWRSITLLQVTYLHIYCTKYKFKKLISIFSRNNFLKLEEKCRKITNLPKYRISFQINAERIAVKISINGVKDAAKRGPFFSTTHSCNQ